jgi:integrase
LWSIVSVDGAIVVSEPKTASGYRRVALDPITIGILKRQRVRQAEQRLVAGELWKDSGLAFTRADGTALRPDHVSRLFACYAADAGVPVIRVHEARHTAATLMLLLASRRRSRPSG